MKVPYIGICDFTDALQIQDMSDKLFYWRKRGSCRRLMAGVMMSKKSLYGIQSRGAAVFPTAEQIQRIFLRLHDHLVMNTLHYADFGAPGKQLYADLMEAMRVCGSAHIEAIQLDIPWPDANAIRQFRERYPAIQIVIQVSKTAIEQVGKTEQGVVDALALYGHDVDYALFDCSIGRGIPLDASFLLPYLRMVRAKLPHIGRSVAGGIGPDTLGILKPIVDEDSGISIDSQAPLRPSGDATQPIDWRLAELYLKRSLALLD